jgi:hypothetical protein
MAAVTEAHSAGCEEDRKPASNSALARSLQTSTFSSPPTSMRTRRRLPSIAGARHLNVVKPVAAVDDNRADSWTLTSISLPAHRRRTGLVPTIGRFSRLRLNFIEAGSGLAALNFLATRPIIAIVAAHCPRVSEAIAVGARAHAHAGGIAPHREHESQLQARREPSRHDRNGRHVQQ